MEATCALMLCDSTFRIRFMSSCPLGIPMAEIIGRHPWVFLAGQDATNFEAALLLVVATREPQQLDFSSEQLGMWRAWMYFCPSRGSRIAILVRKTPADVLLLTAREREVCRHIAEGRSSKQIASLMGVSRKTIDLYRGRICERLHRPRKSLSPWCGEVHEWL